MRIVPTITLREVLELLPSGRSVDFLKIDAQGMDVAVLESAGDIAYKIMRAKIEVTKSGDKACPPLYKGAPTCIEGRARLEKLGLVPSFPNDVCFRSKGCEMDVEFRSPNADGCEKAKKRYLQLYPSVKKLKMDPFLHFVTRGKNMGMTWEGESRC